MGPPLEAMVCCSSCGITLFEICWDCGPCRFIFAMPTLTILPLAAVTLTWMSPRPAVEAGVRPVGWGRNPRVSASPATVAAMTIGERFMVVPPVSYTHLRAHETRHDLV